jgi:hypothetical protein
LGLDFASGKEEENVPGKSGAVEDAGRPKFPFTADETDHCEVSFRLVSTFYFR